MKTIIALTMLLLTACAKSSDDNASSSHGLFSSWTRSGTNEILVLQNGALNQSFTLLYELPTLGKTCTCSASIYGTETSGTAGVSSCRLLAAGSDPACTSLQGSFSYTKGSNQLNICTMTGSCTAYN